MTRMKNYIKCLRSYRTVHRVISNTNMLSILCSFSELSSYINSSDHLALENTNNNWST